MTRMIPPWPRHPKPHRFARTQNAFEPRRQACATGSHCGRLPHPIRARLSSRPRAAHALSGSPHAIRHGPRNHAGAQLSEPLVSSAQLFRRPARQREKGAPGRDVRTRATGSDESYARPRSRCDEAASIRQSSMVAAARASWGYRSGMHRVTGGDGHRPPWRSPARDAPRIAHCWAVAHGTALAVQPPCYRSLRRRPAASGTSHVVPNGRSCTGWCPTTWRRSSSRRTKAMDVGFRGTSSRSCAGT